MLAFGGGGTATGDLTVNNVITISRNDYATADTNNRYTGAVIAYNDRGANTITLNSVVMNSADAPVQAFTNRIVINNLALGAIGNAGVLSLDGDYAGFVRLTGNNAAYGAAGGAIRLSNGVELEAGSEANIGGPASKLLLGGGSVPPPGTLAANGSAFMTNFGAHDLRGTPVNTGVNVDAGNAFNINNFSGVAVGERGAGTFNFGGTNTFIGVPYFDAGAVNFAGATTFGAFRVRSAPFNIGDGAVVKTTNSFVDIGTDSPDNGTVNLTGSGQLIQTDDNDFNVSGTQGTLNTGGTAVGTTGGIVSIGKSANATGTVNVALVLGNRNGTGRYNLSGGTLDSAGEMYVGEGGSGVGFFTQTGGVVNLNNWFCVGREGGGGTVDLSCGTFNKAVNGNAFVGADEVGKVSTMTLRGNAVWNQTVGEFWVGQNGATGVFNLQNAASFTLNNWLALGRAGGASNSTWNQTGGSLTKVDGSGGYLAVGSGGTGTFNQSAGTVNVFGTRLAENSGGTMNLTGGTSVLTGEFSFGFKDTAVGTLNVGSTANVTLPTVVIGVNSTTAANGGTLTAAGITAGASSTALRQFNFNGGTLRPSAANTNFVDAKISGTVLAGGARVDTNGFDATINAALLHASALGATPDGGLIKSGLGNLTLTGANTYTGVTAVAAGTLTATPPAYNALLTDAGGVDLQNTSKLVLDYTGGTSPVGTVKPILTGEYANRFASGQLRSSTLGTKRTLGYGDKNNQVTVMVTLPGDSNLDGTVNFSDFLILQGNFLQSVNGTTSSVTASEMAVMSAFASSDGAVPEPTSLAAVGLAAAGLLGCRRRAAALHA